LLLFEKIEPNHNWILVGPERRERRPDAVNAALTADSSQPRALGGQEVQSTTYHSFFI
jgi:hypothetical protein